MTDRPSNITKIEIHKHLWLPMFTAEIYINDEPTAVARVDQDGAEFLKISKFKSSQATRIAGVDSLLNNVSLQKLEAAAAAL